MRDPLRSRGSATQVGREVAKGQQTVQCGWSEPAAREGPSGWVSGCAPNGGPGASTQPTPAALSIPAAAVIDLLHPVQPGMHSIGGAARNAESRAPRWLVNQLCLDGRITQEGEGAK